jgi:hypothetical protein
MAEIQSTGTSSGSAAEAMGAIVQHLEVLATHQTELIGMKGLPVAVRPLEPANPIDIGVFSAMTHSERVARGIEDIDPSHPDPKEDLQRYAAGMRMDPPDVTGFDPSREHNTSMRYTVVDATGNPIFPSAQLREAAAPADVTGEKPWEGVSAGNVTFFTESNVRVANLDLEHRMALDGTVSDVAADPAAREAVAAMRQGDTLNLEISYYNLDELYAQFPHLERVQDADGKTLITAYQEGIYLTVLDVLRKAEAAGFPPEKIFVNAYVSKDIKSSENVLNHLGFTEAGMIGEYSDDYRHPRRFFTLGGKNWDKFRAVYDDVIAPKALTDRTDGHLSFTPVENPPLGIPLDRITPAPVALSDIEPASRELGPSAFGIDIDPPANHEPKPYRDSEANRQWNADRVDQAETRYGQYRETAGPVIADMYEKVFAVRQGDRLMVILDSGTALDAGAAVAEVAARDPRIAAVDVLYMRTQEPDDMGVARTWLDGKLGAIRLSNDSRVHIAAHDMMGTPDEYRAGLMEYWRQKPSFCVSFQADNYQIRFAKLYPMSQLLGPATLSPGVTLKEFTSSVFAPDRQEMQRKAEAFKELMRDADTVNIRGEDPVNGTDFTYYPTRDWVDESLNDFTSRRDESVMLGLEGTHKHTGDNVPMGEVWTFLPKTEARKSHGRLAFRLRDTEISSQLLARRAITAQEAAGINFDPDHPALCIVEDGYIVDVRGEGTAELVRQHFDRAAAEDNDRDRNDGRHRSNRWVAEPGAGVNGSVVPEDVRRGDMPTVGSEKEDGVLHFGIGNNYDPDEPVETQSKYHLDMGLFGEKLTLTVTKKDGSVWQAESDQNGVFDYAAARMVTPV